MPVPSHSLTHFLNLRLANNGLILPRISRLPNMMKPRLKSSQGLLLNRLPQPLLAPQLPALIRRRANREQHAILPALDVFHEVVELEGLRRNDVQLGGDLVAEQLEWQVVDVLAEGVLDLAADEEDAENNVGGGDGGGDGDPLEDGVELEGEEHHVDPGDLRDGDGVGDGEGGVEDAFGAGEDVVEGEEIVV